MAFMFDYPGRPYRSPVVAPIDRTVGRQKSEPSRTHGPIAQLDVVQKVGTLSSALANETKSRRLDGDQYEKTIGDVCSRSTSREFRLHLETSGQTNSWAEM